eukprot:gene817-1156_t
MGRKALPAESTIYGVSGEYKPLQVTRRAALHGLNNPLRALARRAHAHQKQE